MSKQETVTLDVRCESCGDMIGSREVFVSALPESGFMQIFEGQCSDCKICQQEEDDDMKDLHRGMKGY